jgi:hypothetical protein
MTPVASVVKQTNVYQQKVNYLCFFPVFELLNLRAKVVLRNEAEFSGISRIIRITSH